MEEGDAGKDDPAQQYDEVVQWPDAEDPPHVEVGDLNRTRAARFGEKQIGDQESTQHEKQSDPQSAQVHDERVIVGIEGIETDGFFSLFYVMNHDGSRRDEPDAV